MTRDTVAGAGRWWGEGGRGDGTRTRARSCGGRMNAPCLSVIGRVPREVYEDQPACGDEVEADTWWRKRGSKEEGSSVLSAG